MWPSTVLVKTRRKKEYKVLEGLCCMSQLESNVQNPISKSIILWLKIRHCITSKPSTIVCTSMTEAGIESNLRRDLFVALGEELGGNSWSLHLQYKPLLRLIWLGPLIMIIGGLVRIYLTKPLTKLMS